MIWWDLYLAGVALVLAIVVQLRRMKLEEDGPDAEPMPTWLYLSVLVVAFTWPIWVGALVVLSVLDVLD